MEIQTIQVFTLWHEERQCELTMTLGRVVGINNNTAWRWKLQGKYIPFPVRSNTWFEGFQADVMVEYMRSCGYELDAVVNMRTGKVRIFNRRKTPIISEDLKRMVNHAIRGGANKVAIVCIIRHAFNLKLTEANNLVNQWLDEIDAMW